MKSGYAAVSISAITKEVGITKPTLYHYFPDKEHLYAEVLCDRLERAGKEIVASIEGNSSIREKLFALAYGFFRFSSMCISTLMRDVDEQLSPILIRKVHKTYDSCIVEPHRKMLLTGMEQGELKFQPDHVYLLTDIWLGLLDAMSRQAVLLKQNDPAITQLSLTIISVFLDGVSLNKT